MTSIPPRNALLPRLPSSYDDDMRAQVIDPDQWLYRVVLPRILGYGRLAPELLLPDLPAGAGPAIHPNALYDRRDRASTDLTPSQADRRRRDVVNQPNFDSMPIDERLRSLDAIDERALRPYRMPR